MDLLAHGDGRVLVVELVAEQLAEFFDAFLGRGDVFVHLEIDRVESIEQKMRVVLRLEEFEFRLQLVVRDLLELDLRGDMRFEKGVAADDANLRAHD